nr:putative ribonuclease H-like domain-containing protein [Tanacetum cinerariifolium]
MAFVSSAKNNSGKEDVNTASIPTASTNVSPASVNIGAIDEDDMKEMDIKWNMALLSMMADRFWKKTGKKISIQGTDVAGFDKSKVECFNCHFVRECRAPRSQDRGRRDNYRQGSKVEEQALKALMVIDRCYPPSAQVYSPLKNDMSWTVIPEFADDTITNYTRPSPSVESNPNDLQNSSSSASENGESTGGILSKPEIKFVRPADSPTVAKTNKKETVRKPSVKYAELYRNPTKRSNVRGNISYLSDFEPVDGGYVSFGQGGCKITGEGTIKTGKIKFENVYFVKDLKYNLFSVSQICDNKNSVLFTDSECIVLGRDFKLIDDTNVLLRTPRQHTMYSIDLNNIVLHKDLTCCVAKAYADECMLWHRRPGTKEAVGQDVKKDMSSLRYIVLPNWLHETHLETSTSNAQDACNADAPESSGISNPTATSTNPPTDHMETLEVETPIPTVSSPVPTACLNDSPKPLSDTRLIFKRVTSQDGMPSLDNILTLTNRFEDILGVTTNTDDTIGVEADIGNMKTTITATPTPTLKTIRTIQKVR